MLDRSGVLLVGVVLASACAAGDPSIDTVFDPCLAVVVPAPDATGEEVRAIDDGLALWNDAAGLTLAVIDDPSGEPSDAIEIGFAPSIPAFFGRYDDQAGTIVINRNIRDADIRAIVVAHELGHAFGLTHVHPGDEASLMNPGNTRVPPTNADVERLRSLWGACSP